VRDYRSSPVRALGSFDCVADGHRRGRVGGFEVTLVQVLQLGKRLDNFIRLPFETLLKIGINEVIHRVQLFTDVSLFARGNPGRAI